MCSETTRPILTQVIIRQVEREDLPALEWEGEYKKFRRLYAEAFSRAERGEAVLWVVEYPGNGLIGQLFVQLNSIRPELADGVQHAYIYGVRVRPQYRNQGIGTLLLKEAESDLKARGFRRVQLNVGQDNPDARRLYERQGYNVVGPDPGRWSYIDEKGSRHEVHEPAWRLEKHLD